MLSLVLAAAALSPTEALVDRLAERTMFISACRAFALVEESDKAVAALELDQYRINPVWRPVFDDAVKLGRGMDLTRAQCQRWASRINGGVK